jgi:hypothetical protein
MSLSVQPTAPDDRVPLGVPAWARPRRSIDSLAEAAFLAGGSLTALDYWVRAEAPWSGAWRQRLALKSAAAMTQLQGRPEDEGGLRDALLLCAAGADPGPAGRNFAIWRRLVSRSSAPDATDLAAVADAAGLSGVDSFDGLVEIIVAAGAQKAPAPSVAASVARQVTEVAPEAELFAWWAADVVFSLRMQWRLPVPLLSTQVFAAPFRDPNGRRVRPGSAQYEQAAYMAVATASGEALRLADELGARARRLSDVAPKLRARGADGIVRRLLNEDALPASITTKDLSRWASRRLFERLTSLDAVRELSGRDSFKIFGL